MLPDLRIAGDPGLLKQPGSQGCWESVEVALLLLATVQADEVSDRARIVTAVRAG